MSTNGAQSLDHDELMRRISRDLADSYDEELELEIEDGNAGKVAEPEYRQAYFRELFRLQAELVKLQDWVVANGQKVLILFEGRDAAGKGPSTVAWARRWLSVAVSGRASRRACWVAGLGRTRAGDS